MRVVALVFVLMAGLPTARAASVAMPVRIGCPMALSSIGLKSNNFESPEEQIAKVYKMLLAAGIDGTHHPETFLAQLGHSRDGGLKSYFILGEARSSQDSVLADGLRQLENYAGSLNLDRSKLEALFGEAVQDIRRVVSTIHQDVQVEEAKRAHMDMARKLQGTIPVDSDFHQSLEGLAAVAPLGAGPPAIFSLSRIGLARGFTIRDLAMGLPTDQRFEAAFKNNRAHDIAFVRRLSGGSLMFASNHPDEYYFQWSSGEIENVFLSKAAGGKDAEPGTRKILDFDDRRGLGLLWDAEEHIANARNAVQVWDKSTGTYKKYSTFKRAIKIGDAWTDAQGVGEAVSGRFFPDGKSFIIGGYGGIAVVISMDDENFEHPQIVDVNRWSGEKVGQIEVADNGTFLVEAVGKSLILFERDPVTGLINKEPRWLKRGVRAADKVRAAISPDSRWVSRVDDDSLTIYDSKTYEAVYEKKFDGAISVNWYPDSSKILVVDAKGSMSVVEIESAVEYGRGG